MQRKLIIAVVALSLVLCCFIGGTVAWLTAQSEKVTNTFTVGNIQITLTETTGDTYKVIPGGTVAKDPKVTVKATSEMCYVYVTVENNLVIDSTIVGTPDIDTNKWIRVGVSGNKVLYRYFEVVDATSAAVEVPVFTKVNYADTEITSENIKSLDGKTIVLNAFAHQSDNTDVETANAAATAWAFPANS